jgi:hypothetical protein
MAEDFLRRWSRRKHEHAADLEQPKPVEEKGDEAEAKPAAPLPPVEKLTPESDFTGFMQPKVEDSLRRAALKKLFRDPHFNIPDPFEAYSGDWTVGEPIPPEMLATLNQAKTLLFDKQYEEKPEQVTEEKTEAKIEEKTAEKKADEPRRQDA